MSLFTGTKGIFGLIRQQFDYGSSFYLEVSSSIQLGPKGYILSFFLRSDVPSNLGIRASLFIHVKPRGTKPSKLHLIRINIVRNLKIYLLYNGLQSVQIKEIIS